MERLISWPSPGGGSEPRPWTSSTSTISGRLRGERIRHCRRGWKNWGRKYSRNQRTWVIQPVFANESLKYPDDLILHDTPWYFPEIYPLYYYTLCLQMFSPVRSLWPFPVNCIFQVFKDPMDDFQAPPVPDSEAIRQPPRWVRWFSCESLCLTIGGCIFYMGKWWYSQP